MEDKIFSFEVAFMQTRGDWSLFSCFVLNREYGLHPVLEKNVFAVCFGSVYSPQKVKGPMAIEHTLKTQKKEKNSKANNTKLCDKSVVANASKLSRTWLLHITGFS